LRDEEDDVENSVTYEERSKSRALKCLSFNLFCQILIIAAVIASIFITPWLVFDVNCIYGNQDGVGQADCKRVNMSIFFSWI
jgi:hypothetical protein